MAKSKKDTGPPAIPILEDVKEESKFSPPLQQFFLKNKEGDRQVLMVLLEGTTRVYIPAV